MSDVGTRISLVSVENDRLLSALLSAALEREPDIAVLASVCTGWEAVVAVRDYRPQVLLLDLHLTDCHGMAVLEQLAEAGLEVAALVLSGDECLETQVAVARAGARGFLGKSEASRTLPAVIRSVAAGHVHFSSGVTSRVLADYATLSRHVTRERHPLGKLTEREREVFLGAARGLSNPELSRELFMSLSTVKTHLRNALDKLSLSSRTDAVIFAMREGLLSGEAPPDSRRQG